jgi:hypothetical protein
MPSLRLFASKGVSGRLPDRLLQSPLWRLALEARANASMVPTRADHRGTPLVCGEMLARESGDFLLETRLVQPRVTAPTDSLAADPDGCARCELARWVYSLGTCPQDDHAKTRAVRVSCGASTAAFSIDFRHEHP